MSKLTPETLTPVRKLRDAEGTPEQLATLKFLDTISYWMDRRFTVPGTNKQFGLNSLSLLVPVVGDIIPTLVSMLVLTIGLNSFKVPRIVATRMVLNTTLDSLISLVPLVGNVWDVWFKADTRNVRLLREYIDPAGKPPPLWQHWAFVLGFVGAVVLVVALLAAGIVFLLEGLAARR